METSSITGSITSSTPISSSLKTGLMSQHGTDPYFAIVKAKMDESFGT
ncbi:12464_t:CDS:2, partial [Entrophospora sp. SA101]